MAEVQTCILIFYTVLLGQSYVTKVMRLTVVEKKIVGYQRLTVGFFLHFVGGPCVSVPVRSCTTMLINCCFKNFNLEEGSTVPTIQIPFGNQQGVFFV